MQDNYMKRILLFLIFFLITHPLLPQDWYKHQLSEPGIGNCGPSTVAMVAEMQGRPTTITEARNIIGYEQEDGAIYWSELREMLNAFNISYYEKEDLSSYQSGVVIILADMSEINDKTHNYQGNHFLILYGIENGYYIVADPLTTGNEKYLISEVKQAQFYMVVFIEED